MEGWSYAKEQVGMKMKCLRRSRIPFTFKSRNSFSPNSQIMTRPLTNSSRKKNPLREGRGHVQGIYRYLECDDPDPQSRAPVSPSQIPLPSISSVHLLSIIPRSDSSLANHVLDQNVSSLNHPYHHAKNTVLVSNERTSHFTEKGIKGILQGNKHCVVKRCHLPLTMNSPEVVGERKQDFVEQRKGEPPSVEPERTNKRKRNKSYKNVNKGKYVSLSSSCKSRDKDTRVSHTISNERMRYSCPHYSQSMEGVAVEDTNSIPYNVSIDPEDEEDSVMSLGETKSKVPKKNRLKVRSHLKVSDGTAWLEDSDWEMSDSDLDHVTCLRISGSLKQNLRIQEHTLYPLDISPGFTPQLFSEQSTHEKNIINVVNKLNEEEMYHSLTRQMRVCDVNTGMKMLNDDNDGDGDDDARKKESEKENNGNYEANRNDNSSVLTNNFDQKEGESRHILKKTKDPPRNYNDLPLISKSMKPAVAYGNFDETKGRNNEENGVENYHFDNWEEAGNCEAHPPFKSLPITGIRGKSMESYSEVLSCPYSFSAKDDEIDTTQRGNRGWISMNSIFMKSELFFPPFTFTKENEYDESEIGTKIQSSVHPVKLNEEESDHKYPTSASTSSISLGEKEFGQKDTNCERKSPTTQPTLEIKDQDSLSVEFSNKSVEVVEHVATKSDLMDERKISSIGRDVTKTTQSSTTPIQCTQNTMTSSSKSSLFRVLMLNERDTPERSVHQPKKVEKSGEEKCHEEEYETDNNQEYLEYNFNCCYLRSMNQESSSHLRQKVKETPLHAGFSDDDCYNHYFSDDHDMTPVDVPPQKLSGKETISLGNNNGCSSPTSFSSPPMRSSEIINKYSTRKQHLNLDNPIYLGDQNQDLQNVTQSEHTNDDSHRVKNELSLPAGTILPFCIKNHKSKGGCNKLAQSSCSSHDQDYKVQKEEEEEMEGERISIEYKMSSENWGVSGIKLEKIQTDDDSSSCEPLKSIRSTVLNQDLFQCQDNKQSEMDRNEEGGCDFLKLKKRGEEKKMEREEKRAPVFPLSVPRLPSNSSPRVLTCSSAHNCFSSSSQQHANYIQPTSVNAINLFIHSTKWPHMPQSSVSFQQHPTPRTKDFNVSDIKMSNNESQQECQVPPCSQYDATLPLQRPDQGLPSKNVYQVTRISIGGSGSIVDMTEKINNPVDASELSLTLRCANRDATNSLDADPSARLKLQSPNNRLPFEVQVSKDPVSGLFTSSVTSLIRNPSSFHQNLKQAKDSFNSISRSESTAMSRLKELYDCNEKSKVTVNSIVDSKEMERISSSNPHSLSLRNDEPRELNTMILQEETISHNDAVGEVKKDESEFKIPASSFHSQYASNNMDENYCHHEEKGKVGIEDQEEVDFSSSSLSGMSETSSNTATGARGSYNIKSCCELNSRQQLSTTTTTSTSSFRNKLHSTQLFLNPKAANGFSLNEVADHGFGSLKSCSCSAPYSKVSNTDETSNIPSLCHRNLSPTDSLLSSIETPPASTLPAKQSIRSSSSSSSSSSSFYPVQNPSHSPTLDQPQYKNSTTIAATNLLTIPSSGDLPISSPTIQNDHIQTSRHGQPPPAFQEHRVHLLNPSHDHLGPPQSHLSLIKKGSTRSNLDLEDVTDDSPTSLEQYYKHSLSCGDEDTTAEDQILTLSLRKQSFVEKRSFQAAQQSSPLVESSFLADEDHIDFDPFSESDVQVTAYFSDDDFHDDASSRNFVTDQSQAKMYSNYGNPMSYPLHTIAEESCEESDMETPVNSIDFRIQSNNDNRFPRPDSYDPSFYQPRTFINNDSHRLTRNSDQDDNRSESETEKSDESNEDEECNTLSDTEVDPSSSRLEQYFMSGLLDSTPNDGPSSIRERNFSHQQQIQHEPNKVKSFIQKIKSSSPVSFQPSPSLSHTSSEESGRKLNGEKEEKVNIVGDDELRDSTGKEFNRSITKISASHNDTCIIFPTESNVDETNDCDEELERGNLINSSPARNVTEIVNTNDNEDEMLKTHSKSELLELMTKFLAQASHFKQKESDYKNSPTSTARCALPSSTLLKDLEVQLSLLIENNLSQSGGISETSPFGTSAIGSNNSDYGSDTLESGNCSSEDDSESRKTRNLGKEKRSSSKGVHGTSHERGEDEEIKRKKKERELFQLFQKIMETASSSSSQARENPTLNPISSKAQIGEEKNSLAHQIVSLMNSTSLLNPTLNDTKSFHSERDELILKNKEKSHLLHSEHSEQLMDISVASPSHSSTSNILDHCSHLKHSVLIPKISLNSDSGSDATISASVSIAELEEEDQTNETQVPKVSREMEHLFHNTVSDESKTIGFEEKSDSKPTKEYIASSPSEKLFPNRIANDQDAHLPRCISSQSHVDEVKDSIESIETVRQRDLGDQSPNVAIKSSYLKSNENRNDRLIGHETSEEPMIQRVGSDGNLFLEEVTHDLHEENKTHWKGNPLNVTKSTGNIPFIFDPTKAPEKCHTLKCSKENVKSVHEYVKNKNTSKLHSYQQSATLPSPKKKKAPTSPSVISDDEEEKYIKIPRKYISGNSSQSKDKNEYEMTVTSPYQSSDPSSQSSIRSPSTHSSIPSFFSTSGVLKRLAAFRGMYQIIKPEDGLTENKQTLLQNFNHSFNSYLRFVTFLTALSLSFLPMPSQ